MACPLKLMKPFLLNQPRGTCDRMVSFRSGDGRGGRQTRRVSVRTTCIPLVLGTFRDHIYGDPYGQLIIFLFLSLPVDASFLAVFFFCLFFLLLLLFSLVFGFFSYSVLSWKFLFVSHMPYWTILITLVVHCD